MRGIDADRPEGYRADIVSFQKDLLFPSSVSFCLFVSCCKFFIGIYDCVTVDGDTI